MKKRMILLVGVGIVILATLAIFLTVTLGKNDTKDIGTITITLNTSTFRRYFELTEDRVLSTWLYRGRHGTSIYDDSSEDFSEKSSVTLTEKEYNSIIKKVKQMEKRGFKVHWSTGNNTVEIKFKERYYKTSLSQFHPEYKILVDMFKLLFGYAGIDF